MCVCVCVCVCLVCVCPETVSAVLEFTFCSYGTSHSKLHDVRRSTGSQLAVNQRSVNSRSTVGQRSVNGQSAYVRMKMVEQDG